MSKASRLVAFGILALWLMSGSAHALGLGNIKVHSGLGQPFMAFIPLHAESSADLADLGVGLASPAAFRRAGVVASGAVHDLQFKVDAKHVPPRIKVTSGRPINAPFLNFLVRVRGNNGVLLREYTVLLNPPDYGSSPAVTGQSTLTAASTGVVPLGSGSDLQTSPRPVAPVTTHPEPVKHVHVSRPVSATMASQTDKSPEPSPPIEADMAANRGNVQAPTAGKGAAGQESSGKVHPAAQRTQPHRIGPVKAGQTFWSIAEAARPDPSITMDQVLWAIYKRNRGAFAGGRFDGLMKGVTLQIPSAAQMRSTSVKGAARHVNTLRAGKPVVRKASRKPKRANHKKTASTSKPASRTRVTSSASSETKAQKAAGNNRHESTISAPAEAAPATATTRSLHAPVAAASSGAQTPVAVASSTEMNAASAVPVEQGAAPVAASATSTAAVSAVASTASAPELAAASTVAPVAASTSVRSTSAAAAASTVAVTVGGHGNGAAGNQAHAKSLEKAETPSKPVAQTQTSSGGVSSATSSFLSSLLGSINWRLVAIVVLLILLLFYYLRRRRQQAVQAEYPPPLGSGTKSAGAAVQGDTPVEEDALPQRSEPEIGSIASTSEEVSDNSPETAKPVTVDDVPYSSESGTAALEENARVAELDDPLADAEFHLAYGLYDEAIPLLETAAQGHPERKDIAFKLTQAYGMAGRADAFEDHARALHGKVDDEDWESLCQQGRSLCPGVALFERDDSGDAGIAARDGDAPVREDNILSESATQRTTSDFSGDATGASDREGPGDHVIEFDVGGPDGNMTTPGHGADAASLVSEGLAAAQAMEQGQSSASDARQTLAADDNTLDFDLSDFDSPQPVDEAEPHVPNDIGLEASDSPEGVEGADEPADLQAPFSRRIQEAGSGDADPVRDAVGAKRAEPEPEPDLGPVDSEPTLPKPEAPSTAGTVDQSTAQGDYAGKLDLAEIYAAMGENSSARELAEEVLSGGDAGQKAAAQNLLNTLAE